MTHEEAIDIVRKNYPHVGVSGSQFETALRNLIPELRESEDERIRKAIVATIEQCPDDFLNPKNRDRMLDWLEKQKDHFRDDTKMIEQKPEDDKAFEEWIDGWWKHNKVNNPDSYDKGDEIQFDEKGFKNFCRGVRNMYANQESAEWSEEDEKMYNSALWHIKNSCGNGGKNSGEFDVYNWLKNRVKSLRPQPHWKPSEEQMDTLKNVAYGTYQNGNGPALRSLYEQLKKLGVKEEPEYYQHFDPDC